METLADTPEVAGKVVSALQKSQHFQERTKSPLAAKKHSSSQTSTATELTHREIEVLALVAQGTSNREISEQLVISEGTVKAHISSILTRLGLRDRTQAALYARSRGWV